MTVAAIATAGWAWSPVFGSGTSNQPSVSDETIHPLEVHVGTSSIVTAPWPVSRVSVTQPTIADVQVLTPTQVLLTGIAMGTTDLILWSEKEELWHARVVVNIDLSYIKTELFKLFPTAELDVVQSRDMVVVSGQFRRVEDVARMRGIMDSYNVKYVDGTSVAGVAQVMLNVRVAEASRTAIRQLGVNAVYRGDDFQAASMVRADNGSPLTTGNPLRQSIANFAQSTTLAMNFSSIDLSLFLQALAENQYIRVLAEPTLVALSGEEASFLAGGEYPIPVVQGGGGENNSSITIEYKEFGVKLRFRPMVLGDNTIRLLVAPEVSDLSQLGAVEIQGFRIPSLRIRRSETTLELHSGQTFAMAGLLNDTVNARNSRLPFLGDLPILGTLFRSVRYERGETELVVICTATLVEPLNDDRQALVPGDLHKEPSDWELYIDGRLEGVVKQLAPVDAEWLRSKGLNRLQGPGAWKDYDQPRAVSQADTGSTATEASMDSVLDDSSTH
jgi:pilus assembly protein CpaC